MNLPFPALGAGYMKLLRNVNGSLRLLLGRVIDFYDAHLKIALKLGTFLRAFRGYKSNTEQKLPDLNYI